jgi:hypothetical protein
MRFVAIAAWVVGLVALAAWQTVHPLFSRVALPPPGSVVAAELPDGNPVSDVLVLPGGRQSRLRPASRPHARFWCSYASLGWELSITAVAR